MTDRLAQRCRCLLIARPHYVGDHVEQAQQDAPPATVTIAYASGKTYRYQVADETKADDLRRVLAGLPSITRLS